MCKEKEFSDNMKTQYKFGNLINECEEIRKIYNEFIQNYNELNKMFNYKDPIEVFTMFNYLLENGYLSKDKKFDYCEKLEEDMVKFNLAGTNIFLSKGVCRHIATMFNDILNVYGFNSYILTVLLKKIIDKDYLISLASTYYSGEKYDSFIQKLDNLDFNTMKKNFDKNFNKNSFRDKIIGNHVINYVTHDNKDYFLDPTNNEIYKNSDIDKKILNGNHTTIEIKNLSLWIFMIFNISGYEKELIAKLKNNKVYSFVSKEIEEELIQQTLNCCHNNLDIFEKFYTENKDIYDDVSNKILKLKC